MKGWQLDCGCGFTVSGPIKFLVLMKMKRHLADEHLADALDRLLTGPGRV